MEIKDYEKKLWIQGATIEDFEKAFMAMPESEREEFAREAIDILDEKIKGLEEENDVSRYSKEPRYSIDERRVDIDYNNKRIEETIEVQNFLSCYLPPQK